MKISRCWKIMLLVIAGGLSALAQDPGTEITGFRVPGYDADGEMSSQLFGERAVMEPGGQVKLSTVRMEFYRDGETFMTVESPYCFYNQKTREAHSDAPIAAEMDGVRVRGRGFRLQPDERKVQVMAESRVEIAGLGKDGASAAGTNELTVITSKELFLDYNGRTVRFEETVHVLDPRMVLDCRTLNLRFDENNEIDQIEALGDDCQVEVDSLGAAAADSAEGTEATVITSKELFVDRAAQTIQFKNTVHVDDPRMEMDCGTLNIHFDESNEIDWIEALSKVRILNEGREAYAGRAHYDVPNDMFLLEDNPRVVEGRNMLLGDQIRFWRATGRMVCEPSARVIVYPDEKLNP